jgi:hypothetical protein
MGPPWRVNRFRLLMVRDAHPTFEPGAWSDVETYLGTALPSDYKQLVGSGESFLLDNELYVASPFSRRTTLFDHHTAHGDAEAMLHFEWPDESPFPVYPEPGGLLGWGSCGGGGCYWWETSSPDPDRWPVIVTGRPIDRFERHAMSLTEYLRALVTGEVKAAALGGWPHPGAVLRRLDPPAPGDVPAGATRGPSDTDPVQVTLELVLSGHVRPSDVDTSSLFEPGISMEARRQRMDGHRAAFRAACQPVEDAIRVWGMEVAPTGIAAVHEGSWMRESGDSPYRTTLTISFERDLAEAARHAVEKLLDQLGASLGAADDRLGNQWWADLLRP